MVCLPELPDLSSTPGFAFHVGFLQTVKIRASDSNPFHRLSILTAACRPFSFKVIVYRRIVFFPILCTCHSFPSLSRADVSGFG